LNFYPAQLAADRPNNNPGKSPKPLEFSDRKTHKKSQRGFPRWLQSLTNLAS